MFCGRGGNIRYQRILRGMKDLFKGGRNVVCKWVLRILTWGSGFRTVWKSGWDLGTPSPESKTLNPKPQGSVAKNRCKSDPNCLLAMS